MFEKVSEVELFHNNVISLFKVCFSAPDGSIFERDVVRHVGAVSIVPLLDDGITVILLSQFRASLGKSLLEVPAGKRDVEGEPPEATAVRELEEELGLRCSMLRKLGEFENSPGFTDEHSYSYLASGFSIGTHAPQSIEESQSSFVAVNIARIPALVSSGTITDAKTIIGLLRTIDMLERDSADALALYPRIWRSDQSTSELPSDSREVSRWTRTLPML